MRIGLHPGALKIACTNNEQEEAEEEIEVAYRATAVDIGFNITYLLDALATLSSNEITIALWGFLASALFTMPGYRLQIRGDADADLTMPRVCGGSGFAAIIMFIPR